MSKTALDRYKKSLIKLYKQIRKVCLKNKKLFLISSISLVVILVGISLFLILKTKPNDDIFVLDNNNPSLYANENPNFKVNFGQKEEPEKQWVRFEAKPSVENPFDDEKPGFFKKVISKVIPKKSLGIEMSVVGLEFGETDSEKLKDFGDEVKTVAEILGTDEIETSTELVEMGREIGSFDDDQIISKETIVNKEIGDGIDLEYQILPGVGLKEEIVLRDLSSFDNECKKDFNNCKLPLNEYYFDLKLDDGVYLNKGWYTVKGNTTEAYYFTDDKDNYISHFLPSFAVDDNGNKTLDVDLTIEETEEDNIYRIKVIVDIEWLLSSERSFPIRIDPSIVHDDSADFSSGIYDNTEFDTSKIQLKTSSPEIDDYTVGLWHLDESSYNGTIGEIKDATGVNNGTANSSTASADGIVNSGLKHQTGSSATVPDSSSLDITGEFSFEYWFKPEVDVTSMVNSYPIGVFKRNWNIGGYGSHFVKSTGTVNFQYCWSGGAQTLTSTSSFKAGNWYHYMATYDGSYARLYINGIEEVSVAITTQMASSSAYDLSLGKSSFEGTIDEVRISRKAYTASEVKDKYEKSLGDYTGSYSSSTVDLGSSRTINSFSWSESGVNTGNGEIPYSTTGLVAQWNFNETSGTTAVSGGSCGTSCNGTLTSMITTGQDDGYKGSGWTYTNRKWGNGSIMMDGLNDYVYAPDRSDLDITGALTVSTWVKLSDINTANYGGVNKYANNANHTNQRAYGFVFGGNGSNPIVYLSSDGSSGSGFISDTHISLNEWHHITFTYEPSSAVKIYIDGKLDKSFSSSVPASLFSSSAPIWIGTHYDNLSSVRFSKSVYDVVQIYSRALSESEILSNYQAGNIEFQYRYSDDGTNWSEWMGDSEETLADNFGSLTQELASEWPYYKEITIDDTYVSGSTNFTNFPVLVSVTNSDLKTVLNGGHVEQNDGGDIKFTNEAGTTSYDYEIEKYNPSTGELKVWVEIPTLYASSDTKLRMYYGNSTCSNQENPTGVWDSNYVAVWHMAESSGTVYDSTSRNNDLSVKNGTPDYAQTGKIGNAINFDGSSEYLRTSSGSLSDLPTGSSSFTTQIWYSADSVPSGRGYIVWGNCGTTNQVNAFRRNSGAYRHYFWGNDLDATQAISAGTWYQAAATYDGTTRRIIHNGTSIASQNPSTPSVTSGNFYLGKTCGSEYWDGKIDEIRVSNIARSTDWLKTEYNNQNSPSTFMSISLESEVYIETDTRSEKFEDVPNDLVSTDGLVAYYNLDESNGDVSGDDIFDSSGNNHHGEIAGTGMTVIDGVIGKARNFVADTNYIYVDDSSDFTLGSDYTVGAWINPDDIANDWKAFVGTYNGEGFIFALRNNDINELSFWNGTDGWRYSGYGIAEDSRWKHVAFSCSGHAGTFYVNGKIVASTTCNSVTDGGLLHLGAGGGSWPNYRFDGGVDEVRIYNRKLADSEIIDLYNLDYNQRSTEVITSRDINGYTKIPFWVASDELGTNAEYIYSENLYSNSEADEDTVGYWDMDKEFDSNDGFFAGGGTVTTSGDYIIHTFTSSGTFQVQSDVSGSVEYLIVAGGGGGGCNHGGGGGAGGLLTGTTSLSGDTSYTVTVGAGGSGSSSKTSRGSNGGNSVFNSLTAIGGGGGGSRTDSGGTAVSGANGGSGGGEGGEDNSPGSPGTGTSGQGNTGGQSYGSSYSAAGGGGGGKGSVGGNASSSTGGAGGTGYLSSISGTSSYYAAGGGGGAYQGSGTGGSGGSSIGGDGGGSTSSATNGTAGTGSGGGGGEGGSAAGGNGGSGIVIIRYLKSDDKFYAAGGTVSNYGPYTIHKFTSSGTFTIGAGSKEIEYLVVAGGGGGARFDGNNAGGGGGAGGLLTNIGESDVTLGIGSYTVTVGSGGAGGTANYVLGTNGGNSSISGTGISVTATGGGGGGDNASWGGVAKSGGSGGGGGGYASSPGGAGTAGQGNSGGNGSPSTSTDYSTRNAGGGGGAGAVGGTGSTTAGGNGGTGAINTITGSSVYYAGGGGGGAKAATNGTGGAGGGGAGGASGGAGTSGTANTGGGGGGAGAASNAGSGGSGVVIIRYISTDIEDISGNNNDVRNFGGTYIEGIDGGGIEFNGTSDYASIPVASASDFIFTSEDFTLSYWINPDSIPSTTIPLACGNYQVNGWYTQLRTTGSADIVFSQSGANQVVRSNDGDIKTGEWQLVTFVRKDSEAWVYVNGQERGYINTVVDMANNTSYDLVIGSYHGTSHFLDGKMDEVRISNIARSAEEIRQDYEIGRRSHPITISFKADLQSSNLITNSSDTSFTISETPYGKTNAVENLFVGDKIVIKENYLGTEYIAQGIVDSVNTGTGVVTVDKWIGDSTFPSVGFTTNATVFKWQREYIDIGDALDTDLNSISAFTLRRLSKSGGTYWIDDIKAAKYITDVQGITDEKLDGMESGETPVNSSSLVAQWNFNETSGTTAVSSGSCGTSCNGTLNSFSDTTDQDVVYGSGWTDLNKRWGTGGLMFDGTDDYVKVVDNDSLDFGTGDFSFNVWFYAKETANQWFFDKGYDTGSATRYLMGYQSNGKVGLYFASTWISTDEVVSLNEWHNLTAVRDGDNVHLYLDGIWVKTSTGFVSASATNSDDLIFGKRSDETNTAVVNGYLDNVQIYSRALSSTEVSQNYKMGYDESNIKMEGSGSRVLKDNIDLSDGLLGYYNLDEGNGDLASYDVFDTSGNNNHGEIIGTTVVNGVKGKARDFNGSSDWVDLGDLSDPTEGTLAMWLKLDDKNDGSRYLMDGRDTGNWWLLKDYVSGACTDSEGNICFNGRVEVPSNLISNNTWHHLAITMSTTDTKAYFDGELISRGNALDPDFRSIRLGTRYTNSSYLEGSLDEVRVYDRALSTEEVYRLYTLDTEESESLNISGTDISGYTKVPFWIAGDTLGTNTEAIYGESAYANYEPDANTVGLWHLDKQDNNDFEYYDYDTFETQEIGGNDDWFIRNTYDPEIISSTSYTGDNSLYMSSGWGGNFESTVGLETGQTSTGYDTNTYPYMCMAYRIPDSSTEINMLINTGGWSSVSITQPDSELTSYSKVATWQPISSDDEWHYKCINIDEQLDASLGTGTHTINSIIWHTGGTVASYDTGPFFIDDFLIANKPVKMTKGEVGGDGIIMGDIDMVDGKLGNAMEFDGDDDYINIPDSTDLEFDAGESFTLEAWYKEEFNSYTNDGFITKGYHDDTQNCSHYSLMINSSDVLLFLGRDSACANTISIAGTKPVTDGEWHHVVFVKDATADTASFYVDGELDISTSILDYAMGVNSDPLVLMNHYNRFTQGSMDEVRISNTARSAEDIRQAYEVGRRTHPIEIKFKADLQSSNLITSSSDKSFTISETPYDAPDPVENLIVGETIIIKELNGGTEYKAQGEVDSINTTSGAITVSSWDSGSTFPTGGYTANATVFKWQREYIDLRLTSDKDNDTNAVTNITLRRLNDSIGNYWLDDFRAGEDLAYVGATQYFQYKAIFSTFDNNVSPELNSVTVDYLSVSGPTMEQIMRHGKWFDSNGVKQNFWWVGNN